MECCRVLEECCRVLENVEGLLSNGSDFWRMLQGSGGMSLEYRRVLKGCHRVQVGSNGNVVGF